LNTQVEKYSGEGRIKYKTWKTRLMKEVEDLQPDNSQMLELLAKRTTGTAREIIENAQYLEIEYSSEMALTEAWEQLETHFGSPYQPSQQLIHDILHGPPIPFNDHKALAAFAQKCSAAEKLQAHDPISMTYLDQQITQDTIINRMDIQLQREWHKYKQEQLHAATSVPFKRFAIWIKLQSKIQMDMSKTRHYQESIYSTRNDYPSKTYVPKQVETTPRSSFKPTTPYYPTKDLPRRYPPGNNQERQYKPAYNERRETPPPSPRTSNSRGKCARCTDDGRQHNHPTEECWYFKTANEKDKWTITNKYKLCALCLKEGHYTLACPLFSQTESCKDCKYSHHPIMGCRPSSK